MQELLVSTNAEETKILLVENGKLVEKYEEKPEKEKIEGNIYLGIVENVLPGMQSAFVNIGQEKNTFIHIRDIIPKASDETGNKNEKFSKYNIKDYLKQGMPILVQVRKDSTSIKGARISTHLSLPGRFIVLMPSQNFITISQKIDNKNERERLKSIAQKHLAEGYGAIIRTSAEGKTDEEIKVDLNKIIEKYKRVEQEYNNAKQNKNLKPKLIYKSESILERMLTDLIDQGLNRICVDDEKIYTEILNRLKEENKKIEVGAVKNILEMYDIEKQLEQLKNRKIWLRCGGFITIDKTEALTAIDVNSGKYIGKQDLEHTSFVVNKEATIEIAKQLRLRDIGGIIIIDYIDMQEKDNEEKIIELLKENLKKDRSKTQIVGFSKLNLLEMTRKHMCSNDD